METKLQFTINRTTNKDKLYDGIDRKCQAKLKTTVRSGHKVQSKPCHTLASNYIQVLHNLLHEKIETRAHAVVL